MKTCNECHELPGCGWCDDGSGTGLGQCMEGGDDGPRPRTSNATLSKCSKGHWYFVECPRKDFPHNCTLKYILI